MEHVAVYLAFILVLAIFLGFELISKVPATLHTPLMSGANAISGIAIVGALLAAGSEHARASPPILGAVAVTLGDRQRGRRLPGHGPHARHVQEEGD